MLEGQAYAIRESTRVTMEKAQLVIEQSEAAIALMEDQGILEVDRTRPGGRARWERYDELKKLVVLNRAKVLEAQQVLAAPIVSSIGVTAGSASVSSGAGLTHKVSPNFYRLLVCLEARASQRARNAQVAAGTVHAGIQAVEASAVEASAVEAAGALGHSSSVGHVVAREARGIGPHAVR
jgi:hypothetical protein